MYKILFLLLLIGCETTQDIQTEYCPEPRRVNLYKPGEWTEFDELNLKIVIDNDKCMINKNLPCVIELQKQTIDHYYAICGEKRKPDTIP